MPLYVPSSVAPGTVAHFAASAAPDGWVKCNGAAVSRSTYAALFLAIGTTYGAGDGSTTFNLPDLRGEFVRGLDDGRGVDSARVLGSAQADSMQGHWHGLMRGGNLNGGNGKTFSSAGNSVVGQAIENMDGAAVNAVSDGVNGAPRTGAETRPRNVAMLACIKY